jgi:hypothetical protein
MSHRQNSVKLTVQLSVVLLLCIKLLKLRSRRRVSAADRLLELLVRTSSGAWMYVSCECCVLPDRILCDVLIPRPEKPYRLWCVTVCSRNLKTEEVLVSVGVVRQRKQNLVGE